MRNINVKTVPSYIGYVYLVCIIVLTLLFAFTAQASQAKTDSPKETLEQIWGIEIIGIRSTAADYMLDFRYRVLDAEKAKPLFRRKSRPQLIEQESGAQMGVYSSPKTGPMRTTMANAPKIDRNYFILFANPGRQIKVGNKVTIIIDDFKAENLTVQ